MYVYALADAKIVYIHTVASFCSQITPVTRCGMESRGFRIVTWGISILAHLLTASNAVLCISCWCKVLNKICTVSHMCSVGLKSADRWANGLSGKESSLNQFWVIHAEILGIMQAGLLIPKAYLNAIVNQKARQ